MDTSALDWWVIRAKSLAASYNDNPTASSRPFDKDRCGFVMGEGAGIVVLEELEHAKKRGARIYAEVAGYGLSGDAYHMTAPPEDGAGAALSMQRALAAANLSPAQVGYVNAHATSTPVGKDLDSRMLTRTSSNDNNKRRCCRKSCHQTSIWRPLGYCERIFYQGRNRSSFGRCWLGWSCLHHLGIVPRKCSLFPYQNQGRISTFIVRQGVLPPTLNLHNLDDEFNLNYVPVVAQEHKEIKAALTNSFGFGGTNASLCFTKVE